ncbi:Phytochrome-associated serine/threonine-protein phosphatase [Camellia lanceoleosa]|uniref:Phytochrome-associated serine/threonine-protein phosphatase n=1 Tax=Camellia lanceoleosa TaxID=1840588 RepID=A0ACC0HBG8_9ERIC|nr:Phytochrome-associated serine/threonine-protein phosphatase [Camellia lanceoleosa]
MRPLWGPVAENITSTPSVNLLAIAVGIKQKQIVKQIVEKFLANGFVVMLFHYDDVVDEWRDLEWSSLKYMFQDKGLVTVWSAPNYCYRCGNVASILSFNENMEREVKFFTETEENN